MFTNLTLQRKLVVGFVAVIVAFMGLPTAVAVVSNVLTGGVEAINAEVAEVRDLSDAVLVVDQIETSRDGAVHAATADRRTRFLNEHREGVERLAADLAESASHELGPEAAVLLANLQELTEEMLTVHTEQLALVVDGEQDAAMLLEPQALAVSGEVETFRASLAESMARLSDAQGEQAELVASRTFLVSTAGSAGVAVLALVFAVWLARGISRQVAANVTKLTSTSEDLTRVADRMSTVAQGTATEANVVASSGEQVSQNVQTVATSVDEMSASVREIAASSGQAAGVAAEAASTGASTHASILKLGESSAEIGEIVEVITSIAEQTNLLALNATIEAARAGEAGKGFAVVASEVKDLANQTAKATEGIAGRIRAIQADTGQAVTEIEQMVEIIGRISDMQNTIASAVEEQTATTNEIGRSVNEAAAGSAQIAERVASVAQAAEDTTAGATETQAAASNLREVAEGLQTLVGGGETRTRLRRSHTPRQAAADLERPIPATAV